MAATSHKNNLTGAQRLVMLYMKLLTGIPINPTIYAKEMGLQRGSIYYQLDLLSGMNIPVVNCSYGQWTLLQFCGDN
jgi:hypothetical protein